MSNTLMINSTMKNLLCGLYNSVSKETNRLNVHQLKQSYSFYKRNKESF